MFSESCYLNFNVLYHLAYEENLPEWMTDGPTSQLDTMEFTGFQDIEDEKKGSLSVLLLIL